MHSVRASVNAGDPTFEVTAQMSPVFLYKDPSKYDPQDVLAGLLRGLYLVRVSNFIFHCDVSQWPCQCLRALYISPTSSLKQSSAMPMPAQLGLIKKYGIVKITEPHIVYAALQVSLLSYHDMFGGWL